MSRVTGNTIVLDIGSPPAVRILRAIGYLYRCPDIPTGSVRGNAPRAVPVGGGGHLRLFVRLIEKTLKHQTNQAELACAVKSYLVREARGYCHSERSEESKAHALLGAAP